jgi:hypothetical protein
MADRAGQALAKLALEPEWEAKFEPNSYGFRLGRSCHDAIEAIHASINQQDKYVLDKDLRLHGYCTLREPASMGTPPSSYQSGVVEQREGLAPPPRAVDIQNDRWHSTTATECHSNPSVYESHGHA